MEFHLLLLDDSLDLRVLRTNNFQQVLSESFCACNLLFIWTTNVLPLALTGQQVRRDTDVTWMYIGSSDSLPVSWSTNPEPIPLICTLV